MATRLMAMWDAWVRRVPLGLGITVLLAVVAALFALFFDRLGWSSIFWGEFRSRPHSIVFLSVMGAVCLLAPIDAPLPSSAPGRHVRLVAAVLVVACCLAISLWSMGAFPSSADEYTYWFQAKTFEAGRLWNRPGPLGYAEGVIYVWASGGKWVGQYPPAWPALIALSDTLTRSPWLANALLTVATLAMVDAESRRRAASPAASLAALLFATAPYTLFTGASLMSHSLAAALLTGAVLSSERSARQDSIGWAAVAGALVGLLGLTRLITVAVGLAMLGLYALSGRRRVVRLVASGAAGVPFVLGLLAYQYRITGNPLHPAYWLGGRTADHLYFDHHSIVMGVTHNVFGAAELSLWVAPLVIPLWLWAMAALGWRRALRPGDWALPIGVALFCFYPLWPGIRFGPRYFFDFWPLAAITIGAGLGALDGGARRWFARWTASSAGYAAVATIAMTLAWKNVAEDRLEVYRLAGAQGLHHAAVCLDTPSGTLLPMSPNDAARNGIEAAGDILYIRCDLVTPEQVRAAFPDRPLWHFRHERGAAAGTLDPAPVAAVS